MINNQKLRRSGSSVGWDEVDEDKMFEHKSNLLLSYPEIVGNPAIKLQIEEMLE